MTDIEPPEAVAAAVRPNLSRHDGATRSPGIIAFYVLLLAAPTFYLRRRIGTGRWSALHRLVLVFYAASVWHALILGVGIAYFTWLRPLIWLTRIPLLALLIRRLLQPARTGRARTPARRRTLTTVRYSLVAASAPGIAVLVLAGHSAVIATV